ncbi:hypothetical protein AB3R30_21665 [Leptolyngbyaceae cyanobacterium UHCC 1019]
MSSLVLDTDIPSNINTLERLIAWSGYTLAFVNPTIGVLETPDNAQKVAQAQIFQAADNTYRILIRACLPLSNDYSSDRTVKIWQHTQEVSNVVVPAGFKSN